MVYGARKELELFDNSTLSLERFKYPPEGDLRNKHTMLEQFLASIVHESIWSSWSNFHACRQGMSATQ